MRFIGLVNSAQIHWCALSTAYSLVKCLSLSCEQWQTTSSRASQLKKKKNAKCHTRAFFIRIQMPSKPTFGLHWNYLSACVWFFCGSHALFKGIASTDFSKFNFKTKSHDTIHTFKNYFATVFSVFSNKDLFGYRLLLKTENIVTK